jgi:hypothetical protein
MLEFSSASRHVVGVAAVLIDRVYPISIVPGFFQVECECRKWLWIAAVRVFDAWLPFGHPWLLQKQTQLGLYGGDRRGVAI